MASVKEQLAQIETFASASMVSLVADAVRASAPELLPPELDQLDAIRQARSPLDLKRELLTRVHEELGSRFVFEIGRGIHDLGYVPILQPFLRSSDGGVLLEKWARLERYGHSHHRTRIECQAPGEYVLARYATSGPAPAASHNLFVLGVVVALLEAIQVQDLCVSLAPGERVLLCDGVRTAASDELFEGATDHWHLRWTEDVPRRNVSSMEFLSERELSGRVYKLLSEDPSRSWSLSTLARSMHTSTRTVQRRLAREGTSFSQLVRAVRTGEASRLIETTTYSLTEIAYLCGFTDSAQFSRDFRASVGTSPSEFRTAVGGRASQISSC